MGILKTLKTLAHNIETLFDSLLYKHRDDLSDKKAGEAIVDVLL